MTLFPPLALTRSPCLSRPVVKVWCVTAAQHVVARTLERPVDDAYRYYRARTGRTGSTASTGSTGGNGQ